MGEAVCAHSFKIIKSGTTLLQWNCWICCSGPHWWIFQCRYCGATWCRPCLENA
ncbi:hypothetical protein B0T26DRAFT_633936 [Lasiosphaeria miniovina]|uniref:Uncharacterized protein n=1 Tax=Lasiosphaeria miniovina TaxID=1954250 RepID=A0AA40BI82_9PEZI|nr:uncharacterized protein B0T26DRAFT_633936 [Lasiosphaeria miniovina]KAK0734712.1 hypothetical protein B0T26DRAFT_633936 [Lasiosphaeria miniovina]